MAVAYQTVGTGVAAADATTITITAPASIADGDLLVAIIAVDNGTASLYTLAGWTGLSTFSNGLSHDGYMFSVLYKVAASEAGNYTFTRTGSEKAAGVVMRFNGVRANNPITDFVYFYNGAGDFIVMPQPYVRLGGSLAISFMSSADDITIGASIHANMTEINDSNSTGGAGGTSLWVGRSTSAPTAGLYFNPGSGSLDLSTAKEVYGGTFIINPSGNMGTRGLHPIEEAAI